MTEQSDEPRPSGSAALTCFIIGPIGDRLAEFGDDARTEYEQALQVVEHVIEPACATNGIHNPIRADRIVSPGEIPEQVFELIRTADVVIADLTGGNPNVMYELGLRHTLDKCTICIGEIHRLPFDVSVIRTVLFRRTSYGLVEARDELAQMISNCIAGNHRPVTATRLWNTSTGARIEPQAGEPSESASTDEDEDEPGFLDHLAAMETALTALNEVITEMGQFAESVAQQMVPRTAEVELASQSGAQAVLVVAIRMAEDIKKWAIEFDKLVDRYEEGIASADPGMRFLISTASSDPAMAGELEGFAGSLYQAVTGVTGMSQSFADAAGNIEQLSGVARPLRKPATQLARALQRAAAASTTFVVWESAMRTVLPDPIGP